MITRDAIVAETREWIGTPYHHQHSVKNVSCDCLGLLRGVYRHFVGEEPVKAPNYTPTWGDSGRTEILLNTAKNHLIEVDNTKELLAGQVLVFRMQRGRMAKHCGIVGDTNTMIHAYQGAGRVCEGYMVPYWASKIVGVFEFPGVNT